MLQRGVINALGVKQLLEGGIEPGLERGVHLGRRRREPGPAEEMGDTGALVRRGGMTALAGQERQPQRPSEAGEPAGTDQAAPGPVDLGGERRRVSQTSTSAISPSQRVPGTPL